MKTMKRFAARICALFVVLTVSLTALVPAAFAATKAQLPDLPSSQCVVDDANILSSSTKTAIENLNAQLTQQCEGAQIGVLTVDYTGSLSTEDYAVQAANTWGLGSSSKNNGVLILLVMQTQQYADGDYYLATGDGFRNTTLEKQASAIAQTMEDSFAAGDYDAAVTTCANNVASTIADLYGVTLSGTTGTVSNGNTDGYNNGNDYYEAPSSILSIALPHPSGSGDRGVCPDLHLRRHPARLWRRRVWPLLRFRAGLRPGQQTAAQTSV